jgi:hypothetical protein
MVHSIRSVKKSVSRMKYELCSRSAAGTSTGAVLAAAALEQQAGPDSCASAMQAALFSMN